MSEEPAVVRAITDAQRTKLWAAASEIGLAPGELRDLCEQLTGKRSTRALSMPEAARVIDELVRRGARSGARRRLPPGVPRLVTPWQLERIAELIRQLGWQGARPQWEGVVRRAIGRAWPRTSSEGSRCIEAFKSILRRRFGDEASGGQ